MLLMKRFILALLLCLSFSTFVSAQVVDAPVEDPEPVIKVQSTTAQDADIEARIENIYSKIEGIAGVRRFGGSGRRDPVRRRCK